MARAGWRSILAVLMLCPLAWAEDTRPSPPPSSFHYLQYGVAFAAETVASAGDVCPSTAVAPCILGSGFGPAVRLGYRSRESWYLGGAYEFSRQDPSSLLRLAILQQLRAELRYYPIAGRRLVPYAAAALGGVLYGNEWGAETGGAEAAIGAGLEYQVTGTSVLGAALLYRILVVKGWTDSAGEVRAERFVGLGLAHLISVEVAWELREPLPRW